MSLIAAGLAVGALVVWLNWRWSDAKAAREPWRGMPEPELRCPHCGENLVAKANRREP